MQAQQARTVSTGAASSTGATVGGGSSGGGGGSGVLPGCYSHIASSAAGRVTYGLVCPDRGGYQGGAAAELFGISTITVTDPATGATSTVPATGVVTGSGDTVTIDAETLAERALADLALPAPAVHMSPDDRQIVGLASWLWISPAQWEPRQVSATAGPVTSTVTVTPVAVIWDMGDGTVVTCTQDDMRVYEPRFADTPDATGCSHTHTDSSAGQPDDAFTVTAEMTWEVTWEAPAVDDGGVLADQTTTSTSSARVAELQALVQ
jgi:hypothetical protein